MNKINYILMLGFLAKTGKQEYLAKLLASNVRDSDFICNLKWKI